MLGTNENENSFDAANFIIPIGPHNLSKENIEAYRTMKEKYMNEKYSTPGWMKHVDRCL